MYILSKKELLKINAVDPAQRGYAIKRYLSRFFRYPYLKRFKMQLELMGPRKFNKLLDVGFGSGIFLPELSRRCNELYAVDIHKNIPAVAALIHGKGINAELVEGNLMSLPFMDNQFDCVTCLSVLEFVDDLDRAMREIKRVSKSGSLIIFGAPVLNAITYFSYSVLLGLEDQDKLHKSDDKKIIEIIGKHFNIKKIRYFPSLLPRSLSLFFVLSSLKNE